jgi:Second Messenger Oligonucleotide or Dinucleotide Synthetase domain
MAVAPSVLFTESVETQIDDLLSRACAELQLDESRYRAAERSYLAVGKYLENQPFIDLLQPLLYPQGSMKLNTTVKPIFGDEYDLDFVCQFSCPPTYFDHPVDALDLIERTLRTSEVYDPMVQRMNRCVRLNYQRQFHMDILPACHDPEQGGTCILVPDRELGEWTPSNPKGYAEWFESRARGMAFDRLLEKAEPIPQQEAVHRKSALKLSVQLLKRHRDVRFKGDDLAPISIVLTTVAAESYQRQQSTSRALGDILFRLAQRIRSVHPRRIVILNPKNASEDLSEKWDTKRGAYREFTKYVFDLQTQWAAMLQTRSIDKIAAIFERLFGEQLTKTIVEGQARDIESARSANVLGIKKASGIVTASSLTGVTRIRPNQFYGDEQ